VPIVFYWTVLQYSRSWVWMYFQ